MSFVDNISFRADLAGCLGVEQEFLLYDKFASTPVSGGGWGFCDLGYVSLPLPRAVEFLNHIQGSQLPDGWTYELSACQVEYRTPVCHTPEEAVEYLRRAHAVGRVTASSVGCELKCVEVASENMPLDVYPDERYARIVRNMPKKVLKAACQVAGIHVHYGCRDIDHALRVYHTLVRHLPAFKRLGDHSGGERLKLYTKMASHPEPPVYESVEHLQQVAVKQGFAETPRNCWHLIRISRHGTVEVRCFGNTDDLNEIFSFVSIVAALARMAT